MKERGILQGVLCLIGGVLSQAHISGFRDVSTTKCGDNLRKRPKFTAVFIETRTGKAFAARTVIYLLILSQNVKKNHQRNSMSL